MRGVGPFLSGEAPGARGAYLELQQRPHHHEGHGVVEDRLPEDKTDQERTWQSDKTRPEQMYGPHAGRGEGGLWVTEEGPWGSRIASGGAARPPSSGARAFLRAGGRVLCCASRRALRCCVPCAREREHATPASNVRVPPAPEGEARAFCVFAR